MMHQSKEPKLLQTVDTKLCADSTEWCPAVDKQQILLCGTYQLQDDEPGKAAGGQVRLGKLQRYELSGLDEDQPQLALKEEKDMQGILDIKWRRAHVEDQTSFALVDAVGQLQVWKLADDDGLLKICSAELGESCLGLSLDWSRQGNASADVVASDSTGALTLFKLGSDLVAVDTWKAHDYEAWICAFNYWDGNVVYSGSDDCTLKCWDIRSDPKSPVFINKKAQMGVCSIQSNPCKEHLLAVGSYDEHVYIYDTRCMRSPLSTVNLGGGVWRVKWDPFCGEKVLTATMYNGFHIVDCSHADEKQLPIYTKYPHDVKLGYGADWCMLGGNTSKSSDTQQGESQPIDDSTDYSTECHHGSLHSHNRSTDTDDANTAQRTKTSRHQSFIIATCSFYDHSLQLWTCTE